MWHVDHRPCLLLSRGLYYLPPQYQSIFFLAFFRIQIITNMIKLSQQRNYYRIFAMPHKIANEKTVGGIVSSRSCRCIRRTATVKLRLTRDYCLFGVETNVEKFVKRSIKSHLYRKHNKTTNHQQQLSEHAVCRCDPTNEPSGLLTQSQQSFLCARNAQRRSQAKMNCVLKRCSISIKSNYILMKNSVCVARRFVFMGFSFRLLLLLLFRIDTNMTQVELRRYFFRRQVIAIFVCFLYAIVSLSFIIGNTFRLRRTDSREFINMAFNLMSIGNKLMVTD